MGSGGGGSTVEGAPDFYYRYLVDAGRQETKMSQELMNFYKYGTFEGAGGQYSGPSYADMERAQIEANMELIPEQAELQKAQIAQGAQTAPLAGETERMGLAERQQVIEQRAPLLKQYFSEATNVNPEVWANQAQAGVAQEYANREKTLSANLRRTGATPGSGRSAAVRSDLQNSLAAAVGGAKTVARRSAKKERFNRLSSAVSGAGGTT